MAAPKKRPPDPAEKRAKEDARYLGSLTPLAPDYRPPPKTPRVTDTPYKPSPMRGSYPQVLGAGAGAKGKPGPKLGEGSPGYPQYGKPKTTGSIKNSSVRKSPQVRHRMPNQKKRLGTQSS